MNRNDLILWFGRVCTLAFTAAVAWDIYHDGVLSQELRQAVLAIVVLVFLLLFGWQVYVAHKYDGLPVIPFSFRWVVATWLGSLALFIAWVVAISFFDDLYTDRRSAVIWWQVGVSTLWFSSRWVTVQTPHTAGIGETGGTPGNGGTP